MASLRHDARRAASAAASRATDFRRRRKAVGTMNGRLSKPCGVVSCVQAQRPSGSRGACSRNRAKATRMLRLRSDASSAAAAGGLALPAVARSAGRRLPPAPAEDERLAPFPVSDSVVPSTGRASPGLAPWTVGWTHSCCGGSGGESGGVRWPCVGID